MVEKFAREKNLVERLVQRLGLRVDRYENPNANDQETGTDVMILRGGKRIGVQVTILDMGTEPGKAIAAEKVQAKEAIQTHGGVYGGWGQIDAIPVITAAISRKSTFNIAGFDEIWLLVSCGIPEHGATVSTFVFTPALTADALNAATSAVLLRSSYARAFLHPIIGPEDALYEWTPAQQWRKDVRPQSGPSGPSFWDLQRVFRHS